MSAPAIEGIYAPGAALEHGWSPDTPTADTIQRRSVLALTESTAVPAEAMGARSLRRGDIVATHLGRPAAYWNAGVVQRPLASVEWASVTAALGVLAAGSGRTGTVDLWSPFPTPDLRPLGWELGGHPAAMWRPVGNVPGGAAEGVERAVDATGVEEWAAAAVAAYPLDDPPDAVATAALLGHPAVALFLRRAEGEVVAVSAGVVAHGTNAVTFVATRREHRGRGHGAAVTWAASTMDPQLPATLLASDDGRPVYERMGYVALQRWTMWFRPSR